MLERVRIAVYSEFCNIPFPTTPFPPNIKRTHSNICKVKRGTPQTPHSVYHTALTTTSGAFGSHIHKTLNLAMHVAVGNIAAVFAPLAGEDALGRGVGWHGWDGGFLDEWETAFFV
jgi:hypothetical protein